MMVLNYDPGHLPRMNEIVHYSVQYDEKYTMEQNLDWIEDKGQVIYVIPCDDGMIIVMRSSKGGATIPYTVREYID